MDFESHWYVHRNDSQFSGTPKREAGGNSYVAGDLKGLGFRDLRGSFTPCFPPRLGMIGLSCDF
jgi:hypothetical protein